MLFSFDTNSCSRNHRRYTLCGLHHVEEHEGPWQQCKACFDALEPEMYAFYGTNDFNFEVLKEPPAFKPTRCSVCAGVIRLATDGYAMKGREYLCQPCALKEFPDLPGLR